MIARDVHSIKGIGGSYGLELIPVAVYRMEDDLSVQDLDRLASRPDHIVEKNPHMIERLKRLLCDIGGKDPGAVKQFDRVLKKLVLIDDSPAIHQLLKLAFKRFPEIAIAGLEYPTGTVDFFAPRTAGFSFALSQHAAGERQGRHSCNQGERRRGQ